MKRRNREVSIFSMSALDLFASALGAFILIAIVMFPYFPNTGTADQRDLDDALERLRSVAGDNDELKQIHDELNQAIGALRDELSRCQRRLGELEGELGACRAENGSRQSQIDEQGAEIARLRGELDELEFPHLDLVVALDVTGSMADEIESVKAEIDELVTILQRIAPSVGVGVVAFGDRQWPRPLTQFRLVDVGSAGNRAGLADFIGTLSANMGMRSPANPTPPEAVLAALRAAVDMPWRPGAERRQVVVITDNPAYPEEVEAAVRAASAFAAAAGGGSVSSVFVDSGDNSLPGAEAFLARLASAGRGQVVRAGGSMTANVLLSLL